MRERCCHSHDGQTGWRCVLRVHDRDVEHCYVGPDGWVRDPKKLKLKYLIGIVAVAGFLAVVFGTFGVLTAQEIRSRAIWNHRTDDLLRAIPNYLGERPL